MIRHLTLAAATTALLVATAVPAMAATGSAAEVGPPAQAAASSAKKKVDARKLLAKLTVKAEKATTPYKRSKFQHWVDADGDGCDTRREVLIAEARKPVKVGKGCKVSKGRWVSYFDKKKHTRASALDIDHLVPLAEAWRSGASRWDARTRRAYANDLGYGPSLVAVTAAMNRKKGDKDPASWLPPANRCRYVAEWVAVKYRWGLTVDKAEKKKVSKVLDTCPKADRKVTKPSKAKIGVQPPKRTDPDKPDDGVVVRAFANCTELLGTYPNGVARSEQAAAGLKRKPFVHAGLYEANKKMDRDQDGVACEQG